MDKIMFNNYSVYTTNKGDNFIVDNELSSQIDKYSWCKDDRGYLCANINGHVTRMHDYVIGLVKIHKPTGYYVDHINQDKTDNRITNLRIVTPVENSQNMPLKSDNTSGFTGVSRGRGGKGYRAYITANKKRIELGTYKTIEEAVSARREAEERLGFKTRPVNVAFLCELEAQKDK